MDRFSKEDRIHCLPDASLVGCRGTVGSFSIKLEQERECLEQTVGAIVLAPEVQAVPLMESYGLGQARKAISVSQLESLLQQESKNQEAPEILQKAHHIALLSGFAQEGDTLGQRRIMESVARLQERGYQASIYTPNLKVADQGLEELYTLTRKQGALYFKSEERPHVSSNGNLLSHFDPVLQREVQLEPDLIVVEEKLQPLPSQGKLAELLGLKVAADGLLQEINVHRVPVQTSRKGVFTAGAGRKLEGISDIQTDAANAAMAVKSCFDTLRARFSSSRAFIDKDKCCYCLTCYRCCPHGAILLEDKPVISSLACQGCGICASECPQEAITILDTGWEEIKNAIAHMLRSPAPVQTPKIIAYCCQSSAYEAGRAAAVFDRGLPAGLEMVKVPCAGSIKLDLVLNGLKNGADGLLILGCHENACRSGSGNSFARFRTERLRAILEEVGFSGERIRFGTLAENMDFEFSRYAREMERTLQHLGPNPLARFQKQWAAIGE